MYNTTMTLPEKQNLLMGIKEQALIYPKLNKTPKITYFSILNHLWMQRKHRTIYDAINNDNLIGVEFLVKYHCAKIKTIEKDMQYSPGNVKYPDSVNNDIKALNHALQWAAEKGYLDIVKSSIINGTDINLINKALLQAATNGRVNITQYLLEECVADIHANKGQDLLCAVKNGHFEIVELLIKYDASINYSNNDYAELYEGAKNGYTKIVELLLKHNPIDEEIGNAIQAGAENGHIEIVKLLLKHNPRINAVNNALRVGAKNGHVEIIKLLLGYGATVGNYVLQDSVIAGRLEIVKFLLKHNPSINEINNALLVGVKTGYLEIVELLLENGATVNNDTLQESVIAGHLEIVKFLDGKFDTNICKIKYIISLCRKKCYWPKVVKYLTDKYSDDIRLINCEYKLCCDFCYKKFH
jgi:ankyrin repeat protein